MIKPNMADARRRTKEEVETIYLNDIDNNNLQMIGKNKKYCIKTYGCQMNEHDSEIIKAMLENMGYSQGEFDDADIIVLNTCAIRENAHNKTFGMIGRVKHLKETKKDVITCLCGCMPQEESVADTVEEKYKWIDVVFGTHNIHNFPNLLMKSINDKKQQLEVFSKEGEIIENMPYNRDSNIKAWVNIMYGCDKFCTYCIVPYTRGKQRSRDPKDIVKEIKELENLGYKEVTLLGQNVNAYGKDLADKNITMSNLLLAASDTKIDRIRFMTSHPWDFTDEMVDVIKTRSNVMPYVHLPVQSGSNSVLKTMNRRYTKESYLDLFSKLKSIPNCSITTDIIVGFPNETEDDFNETLDVVKTCEFDSAFTFIYSPRIGTPAASMKDNISLDIKKKRLSKLNKLVNHYSRENNLKYLDKEVKVLLDTKNEKYPGTLIGYTEASKQVSVKCSDYLLGEIVKIKITETKAFSLSGVIIND